MVPMSEARRDVRLTSEQVAVVLRRAAEIEAEVEAGAGGHPDATSIDAAAVEAAAEEVGLSPAAVRQAVAELQVGTLAPPPPPAPPRTGLPVRRKVAPSHIVSEQKLVAAPPAAALAALEHMLYRQMFAARRRGPDGAVFRPRDDMVAKLRRKFDRVRQVRLDGVAGISTVATPVDGGTLVRVEAEMLATRQAVVGGSAAKGAAATIVTGVGGALLHEPMFVLAAFPAGAAVAAGGIRVRGRRWDEQRRDVTDALTLLLDQV